MAATARPSTDSQIARRLQLEEIAAARQRLQRGAAAPRAARGASRGPQPRQDFEHQGMLHVACDIGRSTLEMLVDTGAQMSVLSMPLVEKLGFRGQIDQRYQGVANGVGHARILGKLRGIPVKLGHVEFALDFTVLGMEDPLFILGLDQMRRFKCRVDIEKNVLVFGGEGGIEVPFLQRPRGEGCPTQ